MSKKDLKSSSQHANVNNPNNNAFWQKRGHKKRPKNYKALLKKMGHTSNRQKYYIEADGGYTDKFWKDDY